MSPSLAPPYRLVITDIDGTLLADDGSLPDLNREALMHCSAIGVRVCLATGRRWTTCSRLLERLELHGLVDFCILNNGMILHEVGTGKNLYRREFPFALVLAAVERLASLSLEPVILGHNPDGRTRDVFYRGDALSNADFIDKNPDHCLRVTQWHDLEGAHLLELILIGGLKPLERAADALAGLEVETAIIRNTFYREYMLEITPRGVSKWLGAAELLAHLGLDPRQSLAVGDSANDHVLLKHIPMSIAMANGDDRSRALAREITGGNAEGGFGQAVFRHLPRSAPGPTGA